jgi:nitroreductase
MQMDFFQVLEKRTSVRAFDPEVEVSAEVLDRLLAAAIRAPSAGNRQPWHFYVVRDPAVRRQLAAAAYGQDFVAQAPLAIVVCAVPGQSAARYGQRGQELYCLQDTAAATEHILLAAVALGLGGCWVGAFDEQRAARALHLPPQHRPVAILPIGQAVDQAGSRTSRQPVPSVATFVG